MALTRPRLLLVDDKPAYIGQVRQYLTRNLPDIIIEEARSGEEAIPLIQNGAYTLVLMDNNMESTGRLSGLETIRRLRGSGNTTPIYLHSSDKIESQTLEESGATGHLSKRMEIGVLATHIRELILH
jgi:CheY-like chemotaxis protein